MFKKLAIAAFAATSVIFSAPNSAEAGTCWYLESWQQNASPEYCWHQRRINDNNHIVFDVRDGAGKYFTLVFWDDDVVEVIGLTERPQQLRTSDDADGATRIYFNDGSTFIFRQY